MQLSEALARTSINRLTEFSCLADVLEPDIIQSCLDSNGVATLRKRKLLMDAMVWAVIGMALFRTGSGRQLINKLDIVLPKEVDYVARSAITQACKNSVAMLFVMFFIKLPQRGMSEQSTRIGVV